MDSRKQGEGRAGAATDFWEATNSRALQNYRAESLREKHALLRVRAGSDGERAVGFEHESKRDGKQGRLPPRDV